MSLFNPGLLIYPIIAPNEISKRYSESEIVNVQANEESKELIVVEISTASDFSSTTKYLIDCKNGYLPVQFTQGNIDDPDSLFVNARILEFQSCSKGRVIPKRIIVARFCDQNSKIYRYPEYLKNKYIVRELKVLNFDVDHHPSDYDFAVPIPNHTKVYDAEDPEMQIAFPADHTFNLADLPEIYRTLHNGGEWKADGKSSNQIVLIVVNAIAILAIILYRYHRKSKVS